MRVLILAAGAAAAIGLFLALRPDSDDSTATPTAPTTATGSTPGTTTTASTTAATTTAPPPKPRPKVATIRITIEQGRPAGGIRRASVRQGRRVRFVVRSDVADHVHLHGYDIFRDVAPGAPAQLAFRATIAGRFEVELEDRGLQIADLEVRP